jgi:hypothetical protein
LSKASDARHGIRSVVVGSGAMVDAIATRSSAAALEPAQLGQQLRIIGQLDSPRVYQWEQLQIEARAVEVGDLVLDSVRPARLDRPHGCVSVSCHGVAGIGLEQLSHLGDDAGRVERRLPRSQAIDDDTLTIPMSNCYREGVPTPAARVSESDVG